MYRDACGAEACRQCGRCGAGQHQVVDLVEAGNLPVAACTQLFSRGGDDDTAAAGHHRALQRGFFRIHCPHAGVAVHRAGAGQVHIGAQALHLGQCFGADRAATAGQAPADQLHRGAFKQAGGRGDLWRVGDHRQAEGGRQLLGDHQVG
ncbi:hypothetical protein AR276_04740 [Stenotrophomonas maltophilia]|nr:hypothetical protein AR276_04740 [Stenotrophomonas maltophilia]